MNPTKQRKVFLDPNLPSYYTTEFYSNGVWFPIFLLPDDVDLDKLEVAESVTISEEDYTDKLEEFENK